MDTFPIYLLQFGDETRVVFPYDREDIGHTEFWETTVSHVLADYFKLPQTAVRDLPYSQRRARVVGNTVYYGEEPVPALLKAIRQALGNDRLVFCHDDHEKRLRDDVLRFRRLLR